MSLWLPMFSLLMESREERSWIERQNKSDRQKRKKEETSRIRQLVDNAYACDMRIQRFKDEEKAKKQAIKQAKKDAIRAKQEEEERKRQAILDEERAKKEKEEAEAKELAAAAKKEKEALKKELKKERKTLRTTVKEYDYFSADETERLSNMEEVDKLAEMLSITSLQDLNKDLTSGDLDRAKSAFNKEVDALKDRLQKEKQAHIEASQRSAKSSSSEGSKGKGTWSEDEIQMLIKGVNVFPAGTISRWEVINNFIQQHVPSSKRNAKEVLAKAKDLQKN
ncbi:hypothetical protein CAPTEDRAFT_190785, partial [Capitella teleta]